MIGGTTAREPAAVIERFSPKNLVHIWAFAYSVANEDAKRGQQKVNNNTP